MEFSGHNYFQHMQTESCQQVAEIQVSYRPAISRKPQIRSILDAYTEFLPFYPKGTIALQERFFAMYLNRSNRVIGIFPVSSGGISGTCVDIRLVLSVALKVLATGVILCHNHPSGSLEPSAADKMITSKIKEACSFMDISLIDHLIISSGGDYYSFLNKGTI